MIIRDLTLRSAASFGSFHLIRLLYDEYMFYLVEHKYALYIRDFLISHLTFLVFLIRVAKEIGQTPVAVMMGREDTRSSEDSFHVNGLSV